MAGTIPWSREGSYGLAVKAALQMYVETEMLMRPLQWHIQTCIKRILVICSAAYGPNAVLVELVRSAIVHHPHVSSGSISICDICFNLCLHSNS